jgi:transposase-like protein
MDHGQRSLLMSIPRGCPEALQLAAEIGPYRPEHIRYRPRGSCGDCHRNVQALVKAELGTAVYGWLLYGYPRVLAIAMHHAVLR